MKHAIGASGRGFIEQTFVLATTTRETDMDTMTVHHVTIYIDIKRQTTMIMEQSKGRAAGGNLLRL